jgi:hypothetical protein
MLHYQGEMVVAGQQDGGRAAQGWRKDKASLAVATNKVCSNGDSCVPGGN